MINFQNTYSKLPEKFYHRVNPAQFNNPELILFNESLAQDLGIEKDSISDEKLSKIFSGQEILQGSEPLAQAYAGFQFGHPVPQLGDGRAHLLGETNGFDIQLKGSGQTRFSRAGDGLSALGPVIREYIVSEAMHYLGVPTTRALAAVRTGEQVYRQFGPEPGGIFTRVASSHLRVGTFQYFMFQRDLDGLETLLNYSINRHYPELKRFSDTPTKCLELLKAIAKKQSDLIAKWTSFGFIHGVMNTDNYSIAGITIDYGPCAFMDNFSHNKVFSSIDQQGRYAFFNQVPVAQWNLLRLADCLLPLINEDQKAAIKMVEEEMTPLFPIFALKRSELLAAKLGVDNYQEENEILIKLFLSYLEQENLDFTLAFRNLPDLYHDQSNFFPKTKALEDFLDPWRNIVPTVDHLNEINPLYIARNHQVERAIQESYKGNDEIFKQMVELLKLPFEKNEDLDFFKEPPKPEEVVCQTFCGT